MRKVMRSFTRLTALLILSLWNYANVMADEVLIIDDRRTGDFRSALGTSWRPVTDTVMGGVSSGQLTLDNIEGRACLHLRGDVRLENNGGFVQAALDLKGKTPLDATAYRGVQLEVYGNNEVYNLHLRSADIRMPWQSYRASFTAPAGWHTVRLPFTGFEGHRISAPLDLEQLERIGIVAIGRAFRADLCISGLALY
ncbi:MAG: CIA30 family protein [Gammaproteobacteria bacterium]